MLLTLGANWEHMIVYLRVDVARDWLLGDQRGRPACADVGWVNAAGAAPLWRRPELCACRVPRPSSSSGVLILVKDTAESVSSAYVEVGDSSSIRDRCGNSP